MIEEYKKQMTIYENAYDWKSSIAYFGSIENELTSAEKLNFSVRVLFLINYWFLEGNYFQQEHKEGMEILLALYRKSKEEFGNNPDFIFCIAIITKLNEFPFNIDLDDSDQFLQDAIHASPNTQLYKDWFLATKKKLPINKEYLKSNFVINWREDKGLLGKYVVDYLKKYKCSVSD